jgi:hypothetical protein
MERSLDRDEARQPGAPGFSRKIVATSDFHAAEGSTTKYRRSAHRALQNWLLPMFIWLLRVRVR